MIYFLIAMLAEQEPVVMVREPHAASPWVHSVEANCGSATLTISGYGGGRPLDASPLIRFDDRPLTGQQVERLRGDLANKRGVYRLQVLCDTSSGGIAVRIGEGEKTVEGPVRYWSAAAYIKDGELVSYSGLHDAPEDSFWFR